MMTKGIVKLYDEHCGLGMISKSPGEEIRFYAENIVGGSRARAALKQGDNVLFDIGNTANLHIAVNIKKCI